MSGFNIPLMHLSIMPRLATTTATGDAALRAALRRVPDRRRRALVLPGRLAQPVQSTSAGGLRRLAVSRSSVRDSRTWGFPNTLAKPPDNMLCLLQEVPSVAI